MNSEINQNEKTFKRSGSSVQPDVNLTDGAGTSNSADLSAKENLGVPAGSSPAVPHTPILASGAPVDPKSTVPTAPEVKPTRDRKYASRKAFSELRAARRYVESLGSRSAESLTVVEKSQLSWARSRLAAGEPTSSGSTVPAAKAAPKRQRSGDVVSPQLAQPSKRQMKVINRPYSDVARDSLVRAIVDTSISDGSTTQEKWELICQRLLDFYLQDDSEENPPKCTDAGWFQGHVKLIKCADERSADRLKLILPTLGEVWPGARLQLVKVGEIPRRPRAIATIPAEPHDPEAILGILRKANPNLPTHDWKVVKVFDPVGARRKVIVVLNKETLPLLRDTNGQVYYGFVGIRLSVYRGDDKPDHGAGRKPAEPAKEVTSSKVADTAGSVSSGCSQSTLVGDFLGKLDLADEDALLETDEPEEVVNYDPDEEGEGCTD